MLIFSFPHNPYAEWYYNTIRFPESHAAKYHKANFGNASYDDLLDLWTAKDFDADKMVKLFARAGANYIVPVTKHHVSLRRFRQLTFVGWSHFVGCTRNRRSEYRATWTEERPCRRLCQRG